MTAPALPLTRMPDAGSRMPTESAEREDPRNVLLDSISDMVWRCRELDLEPQLRTRLAALLPIATPPVAVGNWATEATGGEKTERALRLTIVQRALGLIDGRVRSDSHRQIIENAQAIVADEIAACLPKKKPEAA